ncbi:hypothetical protein [Bacillus mycoides]
MKKRLTETLVKQVTAAQFNGYEIKEIEIGTGLWYELKNERESLRYITANVKKNLAKYKTNLEERFMGIPVKRTYGEATYKSIQLNYK